MWGTKNKRVLKRIRVSFGLSPRDAHVFPKRNTTRYRSLVREAVLRNGALGACAIQQAEVGEAVASGDIQEAWRRGVQISYANIRCEKANLVYDSNPNKYSLKAISILTQATDTEGKYLIYNLNKLPV